MLSVAPDAHRFPPSQNIRVRSWFPTLSVMYVTDTDRRPAHNALTGGKTNSGKSLAARMDPVTRRSLISSGPRWSGPLRGGSRRGVGGRARPFRSRGWRQSKALGELVLAGGGRTGRVLPHAHRPPRARNRGAGCREVSCCK